nr:E3 SUMO-protein ligase ZBED1-like [Drosophila kikkawai]
MALSRYRLFTFSEPPSIVVCHYRWCWAFLTSLILRTRGLVDENFDKLKLNGGGGLSMDKYLRNLKRKDDNTTDKNSSDEENGGIKKARVGKSKVWNFFVRSNDGKTAKCISCEKVYRTSGNTSNLFDHLKRVHPALKVGDLEVSSSSKIDSFVTTCYDTHSRRKAELDRVVMRYITTDMRPYSVVEDTGFREMLKAFDPRYKLPSRKTLKNVIMEEQYAEKRIKLMDILKKIDFCGITTDIWTSVANEAFITITCSFVTEDFDLKTAVLSTNKLRCETNHTAENIKETLQAVFDKWDISAKIVAIVTDNASSMIKACELLQKRNIPCFAHTVNLVVQDCLKLDCLVPLLAKCKSTVTYFKSSTIAYKKLRDYQDGQTKYSLKQEVPTRWNSAYYMIDRILKTHEAIGKVFLNTSKAPQPFTVDELDILLDLTKLLAPFDTATKQVSSNTVVTISICIPIACGLMHTLDSVKSELKSSEGLAACKFLMDNIITRLSKYEERSITRIATLIDPRFKKQGFRSPFNSGQAEKLLENEMTLLKNLSHDSVLHAVEPPPPLQNNQSQSLFKFVKQNIEELPKTKRVDAIVELRQYFNLNHLDENVDPLQYWKHNDSNMKQLVRKFLCVPATSTESERMFSKAGLIMSKRRASLEAKNLDALLFLQRNAWVN